MTASHDMKSHNDRVTIVQYAKLFYLLIFIHHTE